MRESNLRSRITTSTATLPVVAILCGTVWAANLDTTPTGTGVVALVAVMTYLMVELNARHALLRVRSRMVSTMFLLVATALPWALTLTEALTATALTAMLFPLFAVYQGGRRPGLVYYMGVCLAIGSMAYPPMLRLSLPLLRCTTARAAWAAPKSPAAYSIPRNPMQRLPSSNSKPPRCSLRSTSLW